MNLPPGWTLAAILKNGDRLICTTGNDRPQLYARVACTASGMDAITPVPDDAAQEYMNAALSVRAATGADCRGR